MHIMLSWEKGKYFNPNLLNRLLVWLFFFNDKKIAKFQELELLCRISTMSSNPSYLSKFDRELIFNHNFSIPIIAIIKIESFPFSLI